jgi:hypothetical protein
MNDLKLNDEEVLALADALEIAINSYQYDDETTLEKTARNIYKKLMKGND